MSTVDRLIYLKLESICLLIPLVNYISEATATMRGKSKINAIMTSSSIFGASIVSQSTMETDSRGDIIEEDDDDEEEQAAVEGSHTGFLCRVNRFTVLTAMIMWMVGKTKHANKQFKKAVAFLAAVKEKKAKDITQLDRECVASCECK